MSLSSHRHHASSWTLVLLILGIHSPESSLAFLPSAAYSVPSKINELHSTNNAILVGTNPCSNDPSSTSLAATKCPPEEWSVLDATTQALSNPSYALEDQNPLPFEEHPEISQGKSTFQAQLSTYQPFWMKEGVTPNQSPLRQTHLVDPTQVKSCAASFPAQTVPCPSKVSKTYAIPKISDPAGRPSFHGNGHSSNIPSATKNPMASTASNPVDRSAAKSPNIFAASNPVDRTTKMSSQNSKFETEPSNPQVKQQPWQKSSATTSTKSDAQTSTPKNGNTQSSSMGQVPASVANHKQSTIQSKHPNELKVPTSKNFHAEAGPHHDKIATPPSPTIQIKKQWHTDIPAAVKSTGAKVVETLSKAYAHPTVSLPVSETPSSAMVAPVSTAETTSMTVKSTAQEQESNTTQKKDPSKGKLSSKMDHWEGRLKALEQALTSLAQDVAPKKDDVVVDTTSAAIEPSALTASSTDKSNDSGDWNLISKLKHQIESLKDALYDNQQFETKTIHWSIPRIDKHLRLSSSTTFQSDPFYVNSIPFHLELQVQEATGPDKEQSVAFYLYHHHWRTHYYRLADNQSQYQPWPFQQERKRPAKIPPPIHVGGSKLKIGNGLEYEFGQEAAIQVGQQDGWGWKHLLSLKELRDHRCIRRGHLDVEFQIRMEKEGHESGRVGVAMIG